MPHKILIVDDDSHFRRMFALILMLEGHTVILAGDGLQGLELAKVERPDLVMTDLGMREPGGVEIIKRLKEEAGLGDVPILVLGSDHKDILTDAIEPGADEAGDRPLGLKAMLGLISRLASRSWPTVALIDVAARGVL